MTTLGRALQPTATRGGVSQHYRQFLRDCGPHFDQVAHIRDGFEAPARLGTLLLDAISALVAAADGDTRIRAFDGFALNYRLTNRLSTAAPTDQQNAPAWLKDHGGPTACVAINELAKWNLALSQWYIDRIREIVELGRHPATEVLDSYSFVSAGQGWTPFGIHNDYEPSFIYHLGPGPKSVWIWPTGEPAHAVLSSSPALNGVSFAVSEHLDTATRYTLEPGDFLCIPAGLYHVFENTDPSAFLGITVFPTDPHRIVDRLLSRPASLAGRPVVHGAAEVHTLPEAVMEIATQIGERCATIPATLVQYLNKVASCGLTVPPHPTVLSTLPEPDETQLFSTRFANACQPADDTTLFAYGRATRTGLAGTNTEQLCRVLNRLDRISAEDIAQMLEAPSTDVTQLLIRLTRLGALTQ